MEALFLNLILPIEKLRIALLRATLRAEFLEKAFRDRAVRLSLLYLLAVAIYLPLSLGFPLWMLAIGPLIWGIPHIFASFRFQNYLIRPKSSQGEVKRAVLFFSLIWASLSFFRIYTDVFQLTPHWDLAHPGLVEAGVAFVILVGAAYLMRLSWKVTVIGGLLFAPLAYLLWEVPMITAGVMILAHNFIAFGYWIFAANTTKDRHAACVATFIFALIHVLVLYKVFDSTINWFGASESLSWANMGVSQIGRLITPWTEDWGIWYRCVCLYAFGQSIHYFVWLKAIPDLNAPTEIPTSFHTAWKFLTRDFGFKLAAGVCLLAAVPLTVWMLGNFKWAHNLYFAMASGHGYFEIAGLALLTARIKLN